MPEVGATDSPDSRSNRQAARTQRDAVVAAAHDLCNHLQVISSALGIIQRAVGSDTLATMDVVFSGARSSLERASRLSRSIVDAERPPTCVPCRTSIGARLAALHDVMLIASGPGTIIEQLIPDDVPDVYCAAEELDDAILNIVANAGRAMPLGGSILITVAREDLPSDRLPSAVLRIADTGCGMCPEVAARAFEPRFTTRAPGEGSGIGLATVAEFVRAAGGSVEIESRVAVGTVVTLRLPGLLKRARGRSIAD